MRRDSCRSLRAAASLAVLLVATGCFMGLRSLEPFPCAVETGMCPSGFQCYEGQCHIGNGTADAGPTASDAALSPEWALWPVPPEEPQDYSISDAGTVTDNVTGLTWQREATDQTFSWDEARSHCANLVLGEVTGWTLPTLIELLSIVDLRQFAPSINTSVFPGTPNENFWSSTPFAWAPNLSWSISFDVGNSLNRARQNAGRARCVVRPSPAVGGHYVIATDGTVYDAQTRLTWQRKAPPRFYKPAEAEGYCNLLPLGKYASGWHLPTKKQLETLVSFQALTTNTLDQEAFPGEPVLGTEYWSSTPYVEDANKTWMVNSYDGTSYYRENDTIGILARCVHEPK
jgi:hypothetical protein